MKRVHRKITELIRGMEHHFYEERMRKLGKGRLWGGPNWGLPVPKGTLQEWWRETGVTWQGGFKLKDSRFSWDIRRKFITKRMVRHWQRLPREIVSASLTKFRAGWRGSEQPGLVKSVPVHVRGVGMIFKVPSNPSQSVSVVLWSSLHKWTAMTGLPTLQKISAVIKGTWMSVCIDAYIFNKTCIEYCLFISILEGW